MRIFSLYLAAVRSYSGLQTEDHFNCPGEGNFSDSDYSPCFPSEANCIRQCCNWYLPSEHPQPTRMLNTVFTIFNSKCIHFCGKKKKRYGLWRSSLLSLSVLMHSKVYFYSGSRCFIVPSLIYCWKKKILFNIVKQLWYTNMRKHMINGDLYWLKSGKVSYPLIRTWSIFWNWVNIRKVLQYELTQYVVAPLCRNFSCCSITKIFSQPWLFKFSMSWWICDPDQED